MENILKYLNTLESQMKQSDKSIIHSIMYNTFNGDINGLTKFSKNISKVTNNGDFINIHSAFSKLLEDCNECLKDFTFDFNDYISLKRKRDVESKDKKLRETLSKYLTILQMYGISSGAIADLLRRHNDFMKNNKFAPLQTDLATVTSQFDERANSNAPLYQTLVKSEFWTNKFVKYIASSLPSMLVFTESPETYVKLDYNAVTKVQDTDKYKALCKSIFFRNFFNELITNVLPPNITYSDLIVYFDGIKNPEIYESSPKLKEILNTTPTPPKEAIDIMNTASEKYNAIFGYHNLIKDIDEKSDKKTNFIQDAFCSGNLLTTTEYLYSVKNNLTKTIINIILKDINSPIKTYQNYGISYDSSDKPILNVALKNHIGQLSVHLPPHLLLEPGMKPAMASMPKYILPPTTTYLIVPATEEQKNYLKAELS